MAVFDSMYCQTVAAAPSQMGLYECAREENAWTYGDGNFRSVLTFNPKFLEKEKGLLNGCLSEVSLHHLYHKQWTALRQSIILTQSFYVLPEVSIEASYRSFTAICLACEHVLSFGIYVTAQLPITISATAFGKSYCHPVQAWIFFRPYFHYSPSSVHYCESRFYIHPWFHFTCGRLKNTVPLVTSIACAYV